jgi:GNAT superfamily N-acetyltransferase
MPAGRFTIRLATALYLDRWLPLWADYNAFYGRVGSTALPREVTESTWNRFRAGEEPIHALVAEADGQLIGFAHYLFHLSTTSIAPACYLRDLYTSEAARGRGVATALIDRVGDAARAVGSADVYWQTHETNAVARNLYEKLGRRSGFIIYQKALS